MSDTKTSKRTWVYLSVAVAAVLLVVGVAVVYALSAALPHSKYARRRADDDHELKTSVVVNDARQMRAGFDYAEQRTGLACPFSIDMVYTWVDSTDAQWRDDYERIVGKPFKTSIRFQSEETPPDTEINTAVESLLRFAPWIRRVHILTARPQVPLVAKKHPDRVKVVHHDECFSDDAKLPVFSTPAILAHLHRIPGLSEHFIYSDDDCFFGNHVFPRDFFTRDGLPVVHTNLRHRPLWDHHEYDAYVRKAANTTVCKRLPLFPFPRHTVRAYTRTLYANTLLAYPKEYAASVAHQGIRSRSQADMSFMASMHGLESGVAVWPETHHTLELQFVVKPTNRTSVKPVPLLCFNEYNASVFAAVRANIMDITDASDAEAAPLVVFAPTCKAAMHEFGASILGVRWCVLVLPESRHNTAARTRNAMRRMMVALQRESDTHMIVTSLSGTALDDALRRAIGNRTAQIVCTRDDASRRASRALRDNGIGTVPGRAHAHEAVNTKCSSKAAQARALQRVWHFARKT